MDANKCYQCPECDEHYETEVEALKCCRHAVEGYSCNECDEFFTSKEAADTCCEIEED